MTQTGLKQGLENNSHYEMQLSFDFIGDVPNTKTELTSVDMFYDLL